MSQKSYHVSDDGVVRLCRAHLRPCKYLDRNEQRHFVSREEAQQKAIEIVQRSYSDVPLSKAKLSPRDKNVTPKRGFGLSLDMNALALSINNLDKKISETVQGKNFQNFTKNCEEIADAPNNTLGVDYYYA